MRESRRLSRLTPILRADHVASTAKQQLVLCTSTGTVVAVDLDLQQLLGSEAAATAADAMEAKSSDADGTAAAGDAAAVPLRDAGPAVAATQADAASDATK